MHIRQVVWVREGELVILEGGERHVLGAGDRLGFGSPSDVILANETFTSCIYLVVVVRKLAVMSGIEIQVLKAAPKIREMLGEILMEAVANGASVSFMHPLEPVTAEAFWDSALAAAARDQRIILGAWQNKILVGTVTLLLDCPPNQPHRAEIAKLMTRLSHRGRGVAAGLMRAAEALAADRARTLLVLDTATEGGASRLYERLGFTLVGEIPDYALKPDGGLTGTLIYWKRIGEKSATVDASILGTPQSPQ